MPGSDEVVITVKEVVTRHNSEVIWTSRAWFWKKRVFYFLTYVLLPLSAVGMVHQVNKV